MDERAWYYLVPCKKCVRLCGAREFGGDEPEMVGPSSSNALIDVMEAIHVRKGDNFSWIYCD